MTSHMHATSSPDVAGIISQIQSLQRDLAHSKQLFESCCKQIRDDMQQTQSLILQLLQQLQPAISQTNIEASPSSISTDDEQGERDERSIELEGMPCPHPDCEGTGQLYNRQDNFSRHYTKHMKCGEKCGVCKEDILWQYDRQRHIKECLKPRKHVDLAMARQEWRSALRKARETLLSHDSLAPHGRPKRRSKKRPRPPNVAEASPRHHKASKLNNGSQILASVNQEEQNEDGLSNCPARDISSLQVISESQCFPQRHNVSSTIPVPAQFSNDYSGEDFSGVDQSQDVPERAPFSNFYTLDGPSGIDHQEFLDLVSQSFGTSRFD
ncbi:hypothetical protein Forpe1208_v016750 [Fusarium oxysporum f. sp. rapae]|uniref:Uncharacterized protein n=1 Tax=Fusarium oxysporum f. sp. rapae TaxID=485398 RepID=A0A8J5TWS4_FUSOX|nr:hypothetical protein Forpe1208_v016750 [Fusarium oxysporum f. sp. rapae]